MSWQAYVDSSLVGTGNVDAAAIFNVDGNSVWASSPGFQVTPQEMETVVAAFKDTKEPKGILMSGFKIQGVKYMTIRADEESLIGKQGKTGMCIVKTKQAILVAHHPEDIPSSSAFNSVQALGDYLKSAGY